LLVIKAVVERITRRVRRRGGSGGSGGAKGRGGQSDRMELLPPVFFRIFEVNGSCNYCYQCQANADHHCCYLFYVISFIFTFLIVYPLDYFIIILFSDFSLYLSSTLSLTLLSPNDTVAFLEMPPEQLSGGTRTTEKSLKAH
jgi:hypothetical protein